MRNDRLVAIFLGLLLLLTACTVERAGSPAGPVHQMTPTVMETATEETPPTTIEETPPTATEETPLTATVLPAPLYYLSGTRESPQIWRLEPDGQSASELTAEGAGVSDFDISPVDGAIVYVTGDLLVRVNAMGGERTVLYQIPEEEKRAGEGQYEGMVMIEEPQWSPDGSQIVFGMNGVNLIDASGGDPQMLLKSDWPSESQPAPHGSVRRYSPIQWSPDGSQMLVRVGFYPEGAEMALLDLTTNELKRIEGIACCNPYWTPDGSTIYISNDFIFWLGGGLWRVDAASGASEPILRGELGNGDIDARAQVAHAILAEDGYLYAWKWQGDMENPPQLNLADYRPSEELVVQRVPLEQAGDPAAWEVVRPEKGSAPYEVLWAPGVQGALLSLTANQQYGPGPDNELRWMPLDGSPMITLPVRGHRMQWAP